MPEKDPHRPGACPANRGDTILMGDRAAGRDRGRGIPRILRHLLAIGRGTAPASAAAQDTPGGDDLDPVTFDPAFYARRHGDLAGVDQATLRAHYLGPGRREGRAAHPAELIRQLEVRHGGLEPDFDPVRYRAANSDLAALREEWELVAHYLEHGRDEGRGAPTRPAELAGYHARNAARLRALVTRSPEDEAVRLRLARSLFLGGRGDEARSVLAEAPKTPDAVALLALGRFLDEFPLERARALLDRVHARHGVRERPEVAELILRAKADRRPFALVRLGDGEGAFMTLGREDEAAHAALYARNRAAWARYWFGPDCDPEAGGFTGTALGLQFAAAEADVLGIPYPGWITHQYAVGDPRGIAGLTNIVRWLAAHGLYLTGRPLASQLIHLDLAASDFFTRLLQGEREVGLVACFPELPERLRARFGISAVDFYKLPGEQHFREVIGGDAAEGHHFPEVYRATLARLARPHHGKVFLVAGGILGKFYAAAIRRHGGIAIDVGSLADVWAGKATRTGYESLPDFGMT